MSDTNWYRIIGIDGNGHAYNFAIAASDWVGIAKVALKAEIIRGGRVKAIKLDGGT